MAVHYFSIDKTACREEGSDLCPRHTYRKYTAIDRNDGVSTARLLAIEYRIYVNMFTTFP